MKDNINMDSDHVQGSRLMVEWVKKDATLDECGNYEPIADCEYGRRIFPDTFTGLQKAKRFAARQRADSGLRYAVIHRQYPEHWRDGSLLWTHWEDEREPLAYYD